VPGPQNLVQFFSIIAPVLAVILRGILAWCVWQRSWQKQGGISGFMGFGRCVSVDAEIGIQSGVDD
jgi:hypothetical protein